MGGLVGIVVMVRVLAPIPGMMVFMRGVFRRSVVRRDLRGIFCKRARAAGAVVRTRPHRLVHDGPNRPGAAAALGAAAEAAIDLARHARRIGPDHRTDLVVGQDITGADDHVPAFLAARLTDCDELSAIAIRLQN